MYRVACVCGFHQINITCLLQFWRFVDNGYINFGYKQMDIGTILNPQITNLPSLLHYDRIRSVVNLEMVRRPCDKLIGPAVPNGQQDGSRTPSTAKRILEAMRDNPEAEFSSRDFRSLGIDVKVASTMITRLHDDSLIVMTNRREEGQIGRRRRWYRAVMPSVEVLCDPSDGNVKLAFAAG